MLRPLRERSRESVAATQLNLVIRVIEERGRVEITVFVERRASCGLVEERGKLRETGSIDGPAVSSLG